MPIKSVYFFNPVNQRGIVLIPHRCPVLGELSVVQQMTVTLHFRLVLHVPHDDVSFLLCHKFILSVAPAISLKASAAVFGN